MATFSGYGPGKRGGPKLRYNLSSGEITEARPRERKNSGPSVHVRFKPFVAHDPTPEDAAALGLKRTKTKGTVFETEAQLNNYLAREKSLGRDTGWKDW